MRYVNVGSMAIVHVPKDPVSELFNKGVSYNLTQLY